MAKIKQGLAILTAIFTIALITAAKSYADSIDTLEGYLFPEIDFKYV